MELDCPDEFVGVLPGNGAGSTGSLSLAEIQNDENEDSLRTFNPVLTFYYP
jgi:hypothetical protein